MNRINMQVILEQNKDLPSSGNTLYMYLLQAFDNHEKLLVDMDGVSSLPSILLNASIGRFIDDKGKDALKSSLAFANITKSQAERLREYLKRYK